MRGALRIILAARWAIGASLLLAPLTCLAQIKAFPQAEGFGAAAKGGRGGDVYHVTNLSDSGVGSLRYGIDNAPTSGRTIVFDVGGWITINSKLGIDSDKRNITIAGQTAPGGIGIRGNQFSVGGDDIVIRHMRFRPGKGAGRVDSAGANADAQRVIYDHISAGFSWDENFSVGGSDITLQYSTVSFGLQDHSAGSLIQSPGGGVTGKLSFHHNLYAHNETRNPKARSELIDWLDNVVYNYQNGFIAGDSETNVNPHWRANFDGNTYISNGRPMMTGGRTQNYDLYYGVNALDRDGDSIDNPISYTRAQAMASQSIVSSAYNWFTTPFPAAEVWQAGSPAAAYVRTLAEFGATPWARDEVDQLLYNDVLNRTGSYISHENQLVTRGVSNGGFGTLGGGVAPQDSDGDGIPDWWEQKHGTNPLVANNNGDFDFDGFTDLEEYLNDLAAFKAPGPLEFSGIGRYADWKRWTNRWEPSRVDDVHVNVAAAFVDAIGQKAGTLRIGNDLGSNGLVYVTSGWLEVTDDLVIGVEGTGALEQYGGEVRLLNGDVVVNDGRYVMRGGTLRTPGLYRGAEGEFSLFGGTLSAGVVGFDLVNEGGIIAPGQSIGTTSILGDLTLGSGSVQIELASALLADLLVVDGLATLGGNLQVQLLNNFVPQVGQSWQILTAGNILGSFDTVTPGYTVQQMGNSLWLVAGAGAGALADLAVPEPSSVMLLGLAMAGLLLRRRRFPEQAMCSLALAAVIGLPTWSEAAVVTTIADAELQENGGTSGAINTGSGLGPSLNARWNFSATPPDKNEWIALKFDLSGYASKSLLENISLRTTMFRAGTNNTKNLRLYALTPGTMGEDWNEATITYGSMPGFTFDGNSTTNVLDVGGALQNLGTFQVSGVEGEGNTAIINPASLTSLVQGMGSNHLLTLLISFTSSSNGQWRIASREATATETGVLTGSAGDFAAYLQFDVITVGLKGDYNDDGVIDAADYTVWRNQLGGSSLMNEEVSPGEVDIADYLYWRLRYGATDAGGAGGLAGLAAVPEPGSLAMLLAAICIMAVGRRSRR